MRAGREPRQADHDVELGRPPQAFSGASRLSGTHAAGASAPLSVGSISPTVPQIPENMIGRIGMNESGSALATFRRKNSRPGALVPMAVWAGRCEGERVRA